MRSDGSLMSEGMAKDYPVETLLSGPAASVVGGSVMAKTSDAVIVDMEAPRRMLPDTRPSACDGGKRNLYW